MHINYYLRLANIPIYYYAVAAFLLIILVFSSKNIRLSLLIDYLFIFLSVAIIHRPVSQYSRINLIPFHTYRFGLSKQIKANILAFIPIGILLQKKWIGVFFSLFIELLQLLFRKGLCDIDDLINNMLGLCVGAFIDYAFKKGFRLLEMRLISKKRKR